MIENLPFGALRVFESAPRHLSFTRAAEELFITPAAVSQQIKTLEEFTDHPHTDAFRDWLLAEAAARERSNHGDAA